jgi:pilus assembly protein CpaF
MDDLLAIPEQEVRELVRRRGVDPAKDGPAGVGPLVDEVLADYDRRS